MRFLYRKPTAFVGLSLHARHICLLKLTQQKQTFFIEDFKVSQLPRSLFKADGMDDSSHLRQMIRSMVVAAGAENCLTAITLPASRILSKSVNLASFLEPDECVTEIAMNLAEYLPEIKEDLYFDYAKTEFAGWLIAAKVRDVDTFLAPIESAGLRVRVVDIDEYALCRAMNFLYGYSKKPIALLDLSAQHWLILHHGRVLFSHAFQGRDQETQLLDLQEALEQVAINHSLADIEKFYLAGNLTALYPVKEWLQALGHFTVEIVNPFQLVQQAKQCSIRPELTSLGLTAFGLAMRSMPRW